MRTLAALIISFAAAFPALASHPVYPGHRPAVVVHVDAFSPGYRAPPRAGFVWIDGYYDAYGWVPGWYEPAYARAGFAWEPGYWTGAQYVSGYWRPVSRPGHYWSAGYYQGRNFVSGRWVRGNASYYRPHPRAVARYDHRANHYANTRPAPRAGRAYSGSRPAVQQPARPSSRPATSRPASSSRSMASTGSTRRGVR